MKKLFYSLKELCDLLQVKPHVVRYWESEFTELQKPIPKGKRKKYTPEVVEKFKQIKVLVYEKKYTIKGARIFLKGKKNTPIKSDIKKVELTKNEKIKKLSEKLQEVKVALNKLRKG